MKKFVLFLIPFLPSLLLARTNRKMELSLSMNKVPFNNFQFAANPTAFSGKESKINNYAVGIMGKYHLSDGGAFRLQAVFAHQRHNVESEGTHSGRFNTYYSDNYQSVLILTPGFQWQVKQGKAAFYGGLGLPLTAIGNEVYESTLKSYSTSNIILYETRVNEKLTGGYSVGLGIIAGSSYALNDHVNIGLEFGAAYQYIRIKGKSSRTILDMSSSDFTIEKIVDERTNSGFDFSDINGAIVLGYRF